MTGSRQLKTWFNKFKDPEVVTDGNEMITPEGYQSLCESLGYSVEGIEALVLLWKLGSKDLGTVTYQNWESGLKKMKVSDEKGLRKAIDSTVADFSANPNTYKTFYRSVFDFLKSGNQRTVETEYIKEALPIVLKSELVPVFVEFLNENSDKFKSITRDQWQLLPELAEFLYKKSGLDNYSTDDSWPKLYDDFVVWLRSRSQM
ncbi:DCN1-like protein 5 [Coemansia sp. RSA 1933]|nr:DCN1-like protein 5 [Coemansia sp. RSA 1933]